MAFDAKSLTRTDWGLVAGGGIVLLSTFLPWYGVSVAGFSVTISGWRTSYGWLGSLLLAAAAGYHLLVRSEAKLPALPVGPSLATLAASGLGLLIVLLRWLTLPRASYGIGHASLNYGGRAGIWIAALAGALEVACAAILFRRSGEAMPGRPAPPGPGAPPAS